MAALEDRKACLLAHHGLLAFERDLAKAMWLAGEVETLAQQTVMCRALGGPRVLPAEEIATVVGKFSRYGLKQR
jgi:L-fuculose-phosphate aldolase